MICGPGLSYHYKGESIDAHLSAVFAALAVSRHIKAATGGRTSARSTARRYRAVTIRAGQRTLIAEYPVRDDLPTHSR